MTYEDQAGRWFKDSCLVAHVTNLVVLGQPDFVRLSLQNGTEVENEAIIGPFAEGQNVILRYVIYISLNNVELCTALHISIFFQSRFIDFDNLAEFICCNNTWCPKIMCYFTIWWYIQG